MHRARRILGWVLLVGYALMLLYAGYGLIWGNQSGWGGMGFVFATLPWDLPMAWLAGTLHAGDFLPGNVLYFIIAIPAALINVAIILWIGGFPPFRKRRLSTDAKG